MANPIIDFFAAVINGFRNVFDFLGTFSTNSWFLLIDNWDVFLNALRTTLEICIFSMLFGFIIGVIAALMKLSSNKVIRVPSVLYVEILRGTPLLVQILFMSFAYPTLVQQLFSVTLVEGTWTNPTARWDAIIVLSLNTGAYQAEIIRAGISSIPKGQLEAARAIGLSYPEAMAYVILPQAFRVITPPLANEFINLVLNSSLVSVIAVSDLTQTGRIISSRTFRTLETWTIVGLFYFSITLTLSRVLQYVEKRYRIPGLGIQKEESF